MGDARDVETTASEVPKTLKQITSPFQSLPEYLVSRFWVCPCGQAAGAEDARFGQVSQDCDGV